MKKKYIESIDRMTLNYGLDCLDGKEDPLLSEDIDNMIELWEYAKTLEKRIHIASNELSYMQERLFKIEKILTQLGQEYYIGEDIQSKTSDQWEAYLLME